MAGKKSEKKESKSVDQTPKKPDVKKSDNKREPSNKVPTKKTDEKPVDHSNVDPETTDKKRTKKVVSAEDINTKFSKIKEMIENESDKIKHNPPKSKGTLTGVMFFKSLNKIIKEVQTDTSKLLLQQRGKKARVTSNKNVKSGLLKPVKMSSEMYEFTGWNPEEPKSRVDVTRFICNYVKTNNLQNESNRRIIKPDDKLAKLLNYDGTEPLTYFYIQKVIQPHFLKE